ncbi:phage portal protein [Escherichia coli]|uniref:Phage portal protein n=1 Tax=Escherichia coli TaxID=562 RepID=A0A377E2A0_ECOLX|nr:phage portal protein [Escherichia coli]
MFFSGLFQRKSDAPVTTPAELADAIGLSYDTYTGKQISSQRAMRLTAVFSCVRVLAESVGMLPCNLYHLNGSLKQRAAGERLHKLISTHPNGYMTPQEFWELVVTCLCLRGNFYAYKVKAFGEVAELLPVDPGCVVPKLNSSWEPVYQVTFPDGSTDVLSQKDIWHVRTLTLDGTGGAESHRLCPRGNIAGGSDRRARGQTVQQWRGDVGCVAYRADAVRSGL